MEQLDQLGGITYLDGPDGWRGTSFRTVGSNTRYTDLIGPNGQTRHCTCSQAPRLVHNPHGLHPMIEDEELRRSFAEINAKLDAILAMLMPPHSPLGALMSASRGGVQPVDRLLADLRAQLDRRTATILAFLPREEEPK